MDELLTAKQMQDTLKVDRTTIYRMLKDGRLSGVKVGNQWRFPATEVQELLSGPRKSFQEDLSPSISLLPLKYVQPVLDVFAEMAEVGAVITDDAGMPITGMSNSCEYCQLIQESERGRAACIQSWRRLARQAKSSAYETPEFITCHAGLQYAQAPIRVCGETVAMLVAGQFYADGRDYAKAENQLEALAHDYRLSLPQLTQAAANVHTLDDHQVHQISKWLQRMTITLEQVSTERADMLARLQQIAAISVFE
jgi:excisionase family DNA binding protein